MEANIMDGGQALVKLIILTVSTLRRLWEREKLLKRLESSKATEALQELSVSAIKLLNWLLREGVVKPAEIDYPEAISVAERWAGKLRTPMASLLLIWAACAAVSGADSFLSFDPRTRALAKGAGLKLLPERL